MVSSLCSTSPCAACRISSSNAGARLAATASTMSHWVEAGSGTPRSPCRPSRRLNGSPLPYFNRPIMLPAVASYFVLAGPCGRVRGEDLAAQVAAQLLQLVHRRRQGRLPGDPHQHARGLLVDGPLAAGGTGVARSQRRVRHVDPLRHPGRPRRRCARDPSRPPPPPKRRRSPRRQPTRSRPRRQATQGPRASRSSARPRPRSSPCANRRTAGGAGGSWCSCPPPAR